MFCGYRVLGRLSEGRTLDWGSLVEQKIIGKHLEHVGSTWVAKVREGISRIGWHLLYIGLIMFREGTLLGLNRCLMEISLWASLYHGFWTFVVCTLFRWDFLTLHTFIFDAIYSVLHYQTQNFLSFVLASMVWGIFFWVFLLSFGLSFESFIELIDIFDHRFELYELLCRQGFFKV